MSEPEHIESEDCWCEPYVAYVDPDTGTKVWVHRYKADAN